MQCAPPSGLYRPRNPRANPLYRLVEGHYDEVKGIKRGILELADLFAINKADGDNLKSANRGRVELERALQILRPAREDDVWSPRVVTSSGLTGDGLDEIWEMVAEHRQRLDDAGVFDDRRRAQGLQWMWTLVEEGLRAAAREHPDVAELIPKLEAEVVEGRTTPTAAAERVLRNFLSSGD